MAARYKHLDKSNVNNPSDDSGAFSTAERTNSTFDTLLDNGCGSPAWICDPFRRRITSNSIINNTVGKIYSKTLNASSDDDESAISKAASIRNQQSTSQKKDKTRKPSPCQSISSMTTSRSTSTEVSKQNINKIESTCNNKTPESRIIAPHVEKLSPASVVEVRLMSRSECVVILCSVDVLKM